MKPLLLPFSWLYRSVGWFRNILFDLGLFATHPAPLPVISVGNIGFGGSEKTPLVMKLVGLLLDQNLRPALVSRGYRGKWEDRGGVLSDGLNRRGTWQDSGDEPYMLSQNYPQAGVFVGKNRLTSCLKAAEMGFSPAVLDDGYQHRSLARHVDIVLYNPQERILLRESVSSLKRADIILLKRPLLTQDKQKLEARFPQACCFEYDVLCQGLYKLRTQEARSLEILKRESLLAFCGIAQPQRFKDLLEKEGLAPVAFHTFPDHHAYSPGSIRRLLQLFQASQAKAMVTTEKDALKLVTVPEFEKIPVYVLKIYLKIEEGFFQEVMARLHQNTGNR